MRYRPGGRGQDTAHRRLHAERRVPGVDAPDYSVASVERQRVGIGKQARVGRPLAQLRLPRLRIDEEEPLSAAQPADQRCLAVHRLILLTGRIRRFDTAKVREPNRLRLIKAYS